MICGGECASVNDICPESSGNCSLETQSRKLRVVSHLISFVFHDVSQMSTLIYFQVRFPFGQALAEALKTNTSVTSIHLCGNSIGAEGVKAFCVPGFQVAAHGVFVASLVKGFVVCSCSSITFPVSNFC